MKKLIITLFAIAFTSTFIAQAQNERSGKRESDPNLAIDNTIGGITFGNSVIQKTQDNDASKISGGTRGTGCDDFNVANTTTITGWTEQSGDWQIFNQMLKTPGNQVWQYITMDGSLQANGCITGRAIYGSPEIKFVGLTGRYSSASSYIMFKIQDNSNVGYWDSYWIYVDGLEVESSIGQNFGTDAIIEMEYAGADVTVRIDVDRNGTWDYTDATTVTNTASGLCGVSSYANAYLDDFCCGAQCGPQNAAPLSNIALYMALMLIVGFIAIKVFKVA